METERPLWRSRAWFVAAVLLVAAGCLVLTIGVDGPASRAGVVLAWGGVLLVTLWATTARVARQRARYEQELADWATDRAAQAERLRIAGELHDIVSHGIGLITLRAAAARSVTGEAADGERERALEDIETASRATTAELRRMLTVLREPGAAPLRPAETLADLPAIVEAAKAAGLTATLEVAEGEPGASGPTSGSAGAQLAVCSVVREALNNTFRHAGPTAVSVRVHREGDAIVVRVRDAGPTGQWRPEPGAGRGLEHLRERLIADGGQLSAGPHGRGFEVLARVADEAAEGMPA